VMVLSFTSTHTLIERVDAGMATLDEGRWILTDLPPTAPDKTLQIPTSLTRQNLQERFLSPDTVSVWALPRFIDLVRSTGLPVIPLQIHFGTLLMLPWLCAALVLIAAVIAWRPTRLSNLGPLILLGVVAGFVVFFVNNFLQALGGSGQIPVWLAVLSPTLLTAAAGSLAVLQIEDR
jgi:lipopolysaccharide export system permease protein